VGGNKYSSFWSAESQCNVDGARLATFETEIEGQSIQKYLKSVEPWSVADDMTAMSFFLGFKKYDDSIVTVGSRRFDHYYENTLWTIAATPAQNCYGFEYHDGDVKMRPLTCQYEHPSNQHYGLCESVGCYAVSGKVCVFPFRYKGRLYNSCVKLDGAEKAWCSTSTDQDDNHIAGSEAECEAGCDSNDCPVGYYRLFSDTTCYRVSGSHSDAAVASVAEAEAKCRAEGARLYQPRNFAGFHMLIHSEEDYIGIGKKHFPTSTKSYTAIGLKLRFETDGTTTTLFADGTEVPENMESGHDSSWNAPVNWAANFPETNDDRKTCVAFYRLAMVNIPCDGFYNGTDDNDTHLGYICETRVLSTHPDKGTAKGVQTCAVPFTYDGVQYDGCADQIPSNTQIGKANTKKPFE